MNPTRLRELLVEARDYVNNEVIRITRAYEGYPALSERKSRPDRELLAAIDEVLKEENEVMHSAQGQFTAKELVQSLLIQCLLDLLKEVDERGSDSFVSEYDGSDAFRALVREQLVSQHNALLQESGLVGVPVE